MRCASTTRQRRRPFLTWIGRATFKREFKRPKKPWEFPSGLPERTEPSPLPVHLPAGASRTPGKPSFQAVRGALLRYLGVRENRGAFAGFAELRIRRTEAR